MALNTLPNVPQIKKYPPTRVNFHSPSGRIYIEKKGPQFLNAIISPHALGFYVELLGTNVRTLNGSRTEGAYKVKFTIAGETSDERIEKVLERAFRGLTEVDLPEKVTKEFKKLLNEIAIGNIERGSMDKKKQIPQEFFDAIPDEWVKRGFKGERPNNDDPRNNGPTNWCNALYVASFFSETGQQDPLNNDQFTEVYTRVYDKTYALYQADHEIYKYGRLNMWHRINDGLDIAIQSGLVRDKPWSYPGVMKYLEHFPLMLTSGFLTSHGLKTFMKQSADIFLEVLMKHPEQIHGWPYKNKECVEMRDKFLELLNKWPKTERMAERLDEAFNHGVPLEMLVELKIKTADQLEELISIAIQAEKNNNRKHFLNSSYMPKPISLPSGWAIADHKTFPKLGSKKDYNCCISSAGQYESLICQGKGIAIYRTDKYDNPPNYSDKKIGLGAVAFYEYDDRTGQWGINQIKAYSNEFVHPDHLVAAQKIRKNINRNFPGPHDIVEQDLAKVKTDEHRILKYLEDKARFSLNREYIPIVDLCEISELHLERQELQHKEVSEKSVQSTGVTR